MVIDAGVVVVISNDLALVVDAFGYGVLTQRITDRGVNATIVHEPVSAAAAVDVIADDLTLVVDAIGNSRRAEGIVEGGIDTSIVQETVENVATVGVIPDDLTSVVDAFGNGAVVVSSSYRNRIVEAGVDAAAIEVSMIAGASRSIRRA